MSHQFHRAVAENIRNNVIIPGIQIIYDQACGGDQTIPLFCSEQRSRATEFSDPDIIILKNNKIRVIIEIEESNMFPNHLIGKFFSSVLSEYYIHANNGNVPIEKSKKTHFIQIIDSGRPVDLEARINQGKNIEDAVRKILPIGDTKIVSYDLLYCMAGDENIIRKITSYINE